jgi:hypothetical protein
VWRPQRAGSNHAAAPCRHETGPLDAGSHGPHHDFDAYDRSLAALIAINHDAFDSAVRDGERSLGGRLVIPPVAVALTVVLIAAGIRPRLAEYR